ncbi:hypothetical protein BS47DRAFT_1341991 [Hydnum rufescens UP504]|uniref:C2H2-type domain-containing protein n=1 Tax=Hydnum rufescens UP504 TaxID=1448309 RepID=A0A9P6DY48_9AGAM|nr:hypothetical protein BS47DRAFT_1341991 [Hydnum rufescens UP504]
MENTSYYDCPWVNCRLHFDGYSAAVEHLDKHLETFLPQLRKDLAHWRMLEFNLSLSDDSLLDAGEASRESSNLSNPFLSSSLLKTSSRGSDTGDAPSGAFRVIVQPTTQSSPPSPVRVVPPTSPPETPESPRPAPVKSKFFSMPRSPSSITDPSGHSRPVSRSTFASINDSSDASPNPVEDFRSPSPGTLFKGLIHMHTASPSRAHSKSSPALGSPSSPVKTPGLSQLSYPPQTPGTFSPSSRPLPSLSRDSGHPHIPGAVPPQAQDAEAGSLGSSHGDDTSKPKERSRPQTLDFQTRRMPRLQPLDKIRPLKPLPVLSPSNPGVAQSPLGKDTPNSPKSPRKRPRSESSDRTHRLPLPSVSDNTSRPSSSKQRPNVVPGAALSSHDGTSTEIPPTESIFKSPHALNPYASKLSYPSPRPHSLSTTPDPPFYPPGQGDEPDVIDAYDSASRRPLSADIRAAATHLDDRKVEAELGVSSTATTKSTGGIVEANRMPVEGRMVAGDAGNHVARSGRDRPANDAPGEIGGVNDAVPSTRNNTPSSDASDADTADGRRVVDDVGSLPWDGISTQAPEIDERVYDATNIHELVTGQEWVLGSHWLPGL